MPNYKSPDNKVHYLDSAEYEHLLPAGSIQITDEEAEALLPKPVAPKPQDIIDSMERTTLLPRVTREFMLAAFAAQAAAAGVDPMSNIGYARLKALDEQISTLRKEIV